MAEYTKGEWKVTGDEPETLTTEDNVRIGCINGELDQHIAFTGGGTIEQNLANAHLIAAAPDLYKAIRMACVCMSFKYGSEGDINEGCKDAESNCGGGAAYAYKKMREALAKADNKEV